MGLLDVRLHLDFVTVRPMLAADGDAVFAALSTDRSISAMTRIPWPYTKIHLRAFLRQVAEYHTAATDIVCAITVDGSDTLVGCCGLHRIGAPSAARSSFLADEVGYWLNRDQRGRGVMRRERARDRSPQRARRRCGRR